MNGSFGFKGRSIAAQRTACIGIRFPRKMQLRLSLAEGLSILVIHRWPALPTSKGPLSINQDLQRTLTYHLFMKCCPFLLVLLLDCTALVCNAVATDILTSRGNNARTGLNANETILTTSAVSSSSFGLLYNNSVDGQVYAQPLYVSNQGIIVKGQSRNKHNLVYVATEHDSLYAFDADSGVQYWKRSLLLSGESPVASDDVTCSDLQPEIGITATPVIDRSAGPNGTIFVVAMSKTTTDLFYRLHAIDLSTGQDRLTPHH